MTIDIQQIKGIFSSFNKSFSSPGVFGLDIGTFNVKAAQIKKGGFPGAALSGRLAKMQPGWRSPKPELSFAVSEIGQDGSNAAVISAIKRCVQAAGIKTASVNLSFSGASIITRYILVPKMTPKDLVNSLEFELAKHIPVRLEDMVIDYQVVDKSLNDQMLILAVGAERRIIEERVNLAKEAGFTTLSINADCFAALEAFQRLMPIQARASNDGLTALLDLGHRTSKLVVFEGKLLRFSRDIPLGGSDLIKAIAEMMNIDLNAAEKLKCEGKENDELTDIISSNLNSILEEVRLSFDYCGRLTQKKISRIYLCGGGAWQKNIVAFFTKGLEIEVKLWNPLVNFQLRPPCSAEEAEDRGPLFATAIGLAFK